MAEEIEDEAVIDSWEDFEENPEVLDKQLKKMSLSPSHHGNMNQYRDTVIVNEEEALRSSTFNSQEPKIMILRRPQAAAEEVPNGNVLNKLKNPVKTLEQRQAEYAQARLRILGNSGATSEESKCKLMKSTEQETENSGFLLANESSNTNINIQGNSEILTSSSKCKPVAFVRPSNDSMNVNVVRSPRGPSTQTGFQKRLRNKDPS